MMKSAKIKRAAQKTVKGLAVKAILYVTGLKAAAGFRLVVSMMASHALNSLGRKQSHIAETLTIVLN